MAEEKKYYWLKLDRNFFKRHDIRIIEDMPNGKEYVLFYMKLLVESIDHNGALRFNELIPYNDTMLSTITNTNIDICRNAIQIFGKLEMLQILDDKTIFVAETQKMLGCETAWAEKKRIYRQTRQKEVVAVGQKKDIVRQEIEKDIEIDTEIKESTTSSTKEKAKRFIPPTLEEVESYCLERKNGVDCERFIDFYTSKNWYVGKNKMKDWKACVRTWERSEKDKVEKDNFSQREYTDEQLKGVLVNFD